MTGTARSVPLYALYGEAITGDPGELVHCETIETRSSRYRWEISPHSHPHLSQALFLASGEAEIVLDGRKTAAQGPILVIAPEGSVHGFRFSEGAKGLVLTLSREFLVRLRPGDPLASHLSVPLIAPLNGRMKRQLLVLGRQLLEASPGTSGGDGHFLQRTLAEALLRTATVPLARPAPDARSRRLHDFQALVERHFAEHRPLGFYAAALGCTERTLARLVQDGWGMTPGQYIHNRIALEARRLLRFTNVSCSAIAEELGFEDPSYFSRFYLRMTGHRPNEERAGPARTASVD